jgi:putative SOS response-associated peptidase YedK
VCSNYRPVTRLDRLLTFFGVERDANSPPPDFEEVWPLGLAPFIRLHEDGSGNKVIDDGSFGLLPVFAKELAFGRKTYNARAETVHEKPSFRESWRKSRRCIIPAEVIYEQCYESGRAERWSVAQDGLVPMGIAGIYAPWTDAEGRTRATFAMLTVNAEGHPAYEHFHAPGEEKRMVLIVHPGDYDRWLSCSATEAQTFFKQWQGPLNIAAAPLARRKRTQVPS